MPITISRSRLRGGFDICLEGAIIVGYISENGDSFDLYHGKLTITYEEVTQIQRKMLEIQDFGPEIPACSVCTGTPYFPQEVEATKIFSKHLCVNPIHHLQRPTQRSR